ncbi:MAG: hypothetical protein M3Y59_05355 [Myxococcota bacterium]|nr:hypothetical protein [Myxococcota bacterium]
MRGFISGALVGGLLWAQVGRAQDEVPPPPLPGLEAPPESVRPPEEPVLRREWYGWQTLIADGAGLMLGATLAATAGARNPEVSLPAWLGTGLYLGGVAGAPLVHFGQRRSNQGWTSLGVRALVPPLGALVASLPYCLISEAVRGDANDNRCWSEGITWGFLFTNVVLALGDSLLLGNITGEVGPAAAEWYGWQLLIADGLAAALPAALVTQALLAGRGLGTLDAVMGVSVYAFGLLSSPILHLLNGRLLPALGAVGLRLLMPSLFILLGMGAFCTASTLADRCAETAVGPSLLVGSLLTAAIDAAWLGWKPRPSAPAELAFFPVVELGPERTRLGFGVAF